MELGLSQVVVYCGSSHFMSIHFLMEEHTAVLFCVIFFDDPPLCFTVSLLFGLLSILQEFRQTFWIHVSSTIFSTFGLKLPLTLLSCFGVLGGFLLTFCSSNEGLTQKDKLAPPMFPSHPLAVRCVGADHILNSCWHRWSSTYTWTSGQTEILFLKKRRQTQHSELRPCHGKQSYEQECNPYWICP